jgi:hypothetical protein
MLLALLVRSGVWLDREAMAGRLEFRALHVGGTATPAVGGQGAEAGGWFGYTWQCCEPRASRRGGHLKNFTGEEAG